MTVLQKRRTAPAGAVVPDDTTAPVPHGAEKRAKPAESSAGNKKSRAGQDATVPTRPGGCGLVLNLTLPEGGRDLLEAADPLAPRTSGGTEDRDELND